jgi:magnesium chelatase subunit I
LSDVGQGQPAKDQNDDNAPPGSAPAIRSLRELIERVSGHAITSVENEGDAGLAEVLPFPFLALVGQMQMKLALLLCLVNPAVGGVLLIGPRGTGKTTAVRSLVDLLPQVPRSLCYYGCMPEDVESSGIDAVCPDCARKYAQGEPLAVVDRVRLVDLPLNARIEDVVGGIDERLAVNDRVRLKRGILAQADRNLLYVDEVNLLSSDLVNAILDAAAQGSYTVRRGPVSATYRSRFVLIGSMNPEEGMLRPQIMDRFGLRVVVRGLSGAADSDDCLEIYRRVHAYQQNPRLVVEQYAPETNLANLEIQAARELLLRVKLPDSVARQGLRLIEDLHIDSLRAEITLFEASRAYAALDGRMEVTPADLSEVAPMALRMRRSVFMTEYFAVQDKEEEELRNVLTRTVSPDPPDKIQKPGE